MSVLLTISNFYNDTINSIMQNHKIKCFILKFTDKIFSKKRFLKIED